MESQRVGHDWVTQHACTPPSFGYLIIPTPGTLVFVEKPIFSPHWIAFCTFAENQLIIGTQNFYFCFFSSQHKCYKHCPHGNKILRWPTVGRAWYRNVTLFLKMSLTVSSGSLLSSLISSVSSLRDSLFPPWKPRVCYSFVFQQFCGLATNFSPDKLFSPDKILRSSVLLCSSGLEQAHVKKIFIFIFFIYLWLCWVFIAVCGQRAGGCSLVSSWRCRFLIVLLSLVASRL